MAVVTTFYRAGVERIGVLSWGDVPLEVLLIASGTGWGFDAEDTSLLDLNLGATELDCDGYSRLALVPSSPAWSSPHWLLPSAPLEWEALGVDEEVDALLLFEAGVDDAASVPLVACWDTTGPLWVCNGEDAAFTLPLRKSGGGS